MAYTIGELSINISAKAGEASRSVGSLANAVKRLKDECSDLSGIVILKKELADIAKIDLSAKAQELKDIAAGYRAIKNASKTKNSTASAKGTVEQPYPIVPYDNTPKDIVPEIKLPVKFDFQTPESLSQLPTVINELPTVFTGVRESAQEADIWTDAVVRDFRESVHEATVESVSDATEMKKEIIDEWEGIPEEVKQGILNPTTEQIKILVDTIKNNFINRTFGSIIASMNDFSTGIRRRLNAITSRIMRIAGYRIIRSAIAAVTKEFREGLEVAYEWSANAENGFTGVAEAMDSLASSGAQMKNQLGAAFGQLMVSLAPFFNWLKNEVISVSNALTEFFAALAGEKQYMKALPIETKWKDIEENEKDATKALKDYKQQLLGIDELNVLNTPSNKAGAVAEELPTEPIYELAPVEKSWATDLFIDITDVLFNWDNLSETDVQEKILTGLIAVAGGIAGFALGGVSGALKGATLGLIAGVLISKFVFDDSELSTGQKVAQTTLLGIMGTAVGGIIGFHIGGVKGSVVGGAIGLVAGVMLTKVLFDTDKMEKIPENEIKDTLNDCIGATTGAVIGFQIGGVWGAGLGFAIGLVGSIILNAINVTTDEEAYANYNESEFKEFLDEFDKNKLQPLANEHLKISAIIDGVELGKNAFTSDETKKIELAKQLIDRIFTLDDIEIKTPAELEELKRLIEQVNGLGLDNLQIEFDDLKKKVKNSKKQIKEHLDALLAHARLEAGWENYQKLMRAAIDADTDYITAEEALQELKDVEKEKSKEWEQTKSDLTDAEKEYKDAVYELNNVYDKKYNRTVAESVKREEELRDLIPTLKEKYDKLTLSVLEQEMGLTDTRKEIKKTEKQMNNFASDSEKAREKADKLKSIILDETQAFNNLGTAVDNDTKSLKDYKTASQDVSKASPKLKDAIDKCKGAFADIKSAIADSITELGKFDEKTGTKRSIEFEYVVSANMSDTAMLETIKGLKSAGVMASGGFAQGGHLFFANENGNPEYIGNMGGRTAVANSDQMSAAIEAASYAGMSRALAENNKNPMENWQPMSAEEMYLLLRSKSNQNGLRTGVGYAF